MNPNGGFMEKRFGRLTLLDFSHKSSSRKYFWNCRCGCGNEVKYRIDALKLGRRKSCGCIKSPLPEEYKEKVEKRLLSGSKISGKCREWKGRKSPGGYGLFKVRVKEINGLSDVTPKRTQFNLGVHRVAYKIWVGDIPKGKYVLHTCDNRLCINPEHLFLGSHQDNMDDMISKNRQNKRPGESHHLTKLKEEDIMEIRRLWDSGNETQKGIGIKLGIPGVTIHNIVRRKTWKHI
jgi:hypothetical protein